MFFFNPDLAANDMMEDGDEAIDSYAREEDDNDGEVQVCFKLEFEIMGPNVSDLCL